MAAVLAVLADTHSAVWYLQQSSRLTRRAEQALDSASAAGDPIYLASISLVEVCYLVERGRLPHEALERLYAALEGPLAAFALAPLDSAVTKAIGRVPRSAVPDMPDRIIAATALVLNVPLVTADAKLRATRIATIW
jgi:PIN domain nuclease of toxin-antitoxin system